MTYDAMILESCESREHRSSNLVTYLCPEHTPLYGGGHYHSRHRVIQVSTRDRAVLSVASDGTVFYVELLSQILSLDLTREHLFLLCKYHNISVPHSLRSKERLRQLFSRHVCNHWCISCGVILRTIAEAVGGSQHQVPTGDRMSSFSTIAGTGTSHADDTLVFVTFCRLVSHPAQCPNKLIMLLITFLSSVTWISFLILPCFFLLISMACRCSHRLLDLN